MCTRRERGLALAQTAVKAGLCDLLHLLLRADPLTRGMHPPADTGTARLCYGYQWCLKKLFAELKGIQAHQQVQAQPRPRVLDHSSPVTLAALQDDLLLIVVLLAQWAWCQAGARGTLSVIILPLTPHTRRRGAALRTGHTPVGGPSRHNDINHTPHGSTNFTTLITAHINTWQVK